jgi:hypothetical protein
MMMSGTYYVGDLCYVTSNEEWREICDLTINAREIIDNEFELSDGRKFALFSTPHGDGEYSSDVSTSHSVDSGTIGCILKSDIKCNNYNQDYLESLGAFINFEKDFCVGTTEEGTIMFGHVYIETGNVYDDYEHDKDYDRDY